MTGTFRFQTGFYGLTDMFAEFRKTMDYSLIGLKYNFVFRKEWRGSRKRPTTERKNHRRRITIPLLNILSPSHSLRARGATQIRKVHANGGSRRTLKAYMKYWLGIKYHQVSPPASTLKEQGESIVKVRNSDIAKTWDTAWTTITTKGISRSPRSTNKRDIGGGKNSKPCKRD